MTGKLLLTLSGSGGGEAASWRATLSIMAGNAAGMLAWSREMLTCRGRAPRESRSSRAAEGVMGVPVACRAWGRRGWQSRGQQKIARELGALRT